MKRYSGIIVRNDNKVLLAKRNNKGSNPGEWSIFGGSVEEGENPIDGARREFFEETNCQVDGDITLCGMMERHTRDGKKLKGMMYVFLLDSKDLISPDLALAHDGDEHSNWGYFTKDEIPSPISPKLKEIVRIILK